jgi:hypothetical protein
VHELVVEVSVEKAYRVLPLDSRIFPYIESDTTAIVAAEELALPEEPAAVEGLAYIVELGAVVDALEVLGGADALDVLVDEPQAAARRAMPTAIAAPVDLLIKYTFLNLVR